MIKRTNFNRFIWILLAILAVPTFLPLLYTGLTNSDSLIFFHTARSLQDIPSLLGMGYEQFLCQGRFTNLLTGWCMYLPYYTHSRFLFLLLTILPIILDVLLIIVLIRKYAHNESVAQLATLTILCVFTIHMGFSGSIGYPFWFSFSFLFLLLSLLFLFRYKETQKYRFIILSAIFMFLTTIFYEAYLAYYIVIYLILRSQYNSNIYREKASRLKFIKELLPFVICGLIFVAAYIILAKSITTTYSGAKWSFSPLKTLRSWGNLILYSIPGMSFYQYRIPLANFTGDPQFKYTFFYIFTHTGVMAWVKGLLAVTIFYGILSTLDIKITGKKLWFALLIAVMMAILPHLILCCSSKYIQEIPDSYITSYFANFGMALTIIVIFLLGRHYLSKQALIQKIFTAIFACGLLLVTILVQFTNEQVMQDIKRANLRYTQSEKFLQKAKIAPDGIMPVWTGRFQVTPTHTGKMICSDLHATVNAYLGYDGNYETDYSAFYQKYRTSDDDVAIFTCQQSAKSDDLYFIWFQCKGTDLTEDFTEIACDTIVVGYYSAYKTFALSIHSEQDSDEVRVNGDILHAQSNAHYGNIQYLNKPTIQIFTLTGKQMLPATLSISNILFPGIVPINFNHLPPHYRKDGIRYYEHDIWKHQSLKRQLDSTALQKGKDPDEFLRGNAEWLLVFPEQY